MLAMKRFASRILTDYGMLLPLIALCAVFSAMTISDQTPTSDVAARQVADAVTSHSKSPRVFIAVRDQADDVEFSSQLSERLKQAGADVVGVAIGKPKDARDALQQIAAAGRTIDAIACTSESSQWHFLGDLKSNFPSLGDPRVVSPFTYRWPTFLMPGNLINIANQIAVTAIIAIGMTMVIVTGGIDLSVGSLIALSAVLAAGFIRDLAGGLDATPLGLLAASAAAVAACGLVGAFTGFSITRFDLPPFIVTLSVMLMTRGAAYTYTNGLAITDVPDSYQWLGRGTDLLGIPNAVVLMLVLYVAAEILMSRMRLGRYLYAVGGNREAARLAGVPVDLVITFAYVLSAVLAGVGGVIQASLFKSGSPNYGIMDEFNVIAAVVVGGTSLSGGEGKIFGTLIGAFTIGIIRNWMNISNIDPFLQGSVLGAVIYAAVLFDKLRRGRVAK